LPCEVRLVSVETVARERLLALLDEYASGVGHPFQGEDVVVEAWDGATWLGALMGHANQGWFFVSLLGVVPAARGRGVGSQLMHRAEVFARERALVGLWLDTFSWQAPSFYQRLGFTEVGRIPDHPPGEARVFLAKRLDGGALWPGQTGP
jgi:ribosomal protein S18 acetylase RimI-like enzyme